MKSRLFEPLEAVQGEHNGHPSHPAPVHVLSPDRLETAPAAIPADFGGPICAAVDGNINSADGIDFDFHR